MCLRRCRLVAGFGLVIVGAVSMLMIASPLARAQERLSDSTPGDTLDLLPVAPFEADVLVDMDDSPAVDQGDPSISDPETEETQPGDPSSEAASAAEAWGFLGFGTEAELRRSQNDQEQVGDEADGLLGPIRPIR